MKDVKENLIDDSYSRQACSHKSLRREYSKDYNNRGENDDSNEDVDSCD